MTVILITVTDRDAAYIARWVERDGAVRVCPASGHPGFGVNAVDVQLDPEGPRL